MVPLIDTILSNEKVRIHPFQDVSPKKIFSFAPTLAHVLVCPSFGA